MAEIKTDETHLEDLIKIKRRVFDVLLITHAKRRNLDGSFVIQQPQLNRNDAHSCVSLEPLIKDQAFHQTVMPNLPHKLSCSFDNLNHYWVLRVMELSRHQIS